MGLFAPGWMSKNEDKAQESLARISDPDEYVRVVLESPWKNVRLAAVERIDGDPALIRVLTASICPDVHGAIISRLRGQNSLISYALHGKFTSAQKIALSRIDDQQALRTVVLEHSNKQLKEAAIIRITDNQFFVDVVHGKWSLSSELQICAIRSITQESAARQLYPEIQSGRFMGRTDSYIYLLLEGLNAPEFLLELALSETEAPFTRALAMKQLGTLGVREYAEKLSALKRNTMSLGSRPEFFGKTLGEVAKEVCAKLSGKDVFEMDAENEDESFLKLQIYIMMNKGGINNIEQRHAMERIRAFYRAGRFKERIERLNGRVVTPHIDGPSETCVDNHVDVPEAVFHL